MVMSNREHWIEDDNESVASQSVADGANNTTGNRTEMDAERLTLARKENATVLWMNGLVFGVLLIAAISVSWGVYAYTHGDQVHDFEDAFRADATKLIEAFHQSVSRQLNALDALGTSITTHAISSGSTFPNVTLPNYEIAFANSRILSGATFIQYNPIVQEKDRLGWEEYYREYLAGPYNAAFATESSLLIQQDERYSPNDKSRRLNDQIMDFGTDLMPVVALEGSGPYIPLMVMSPSVDIMGFYNTNLLTHPLTSAAKEILTTPKAVIGGSAMLDLACSEFFTHVLSRGQYRHSIDQYQNDPLSMVFYPVFDTFDLDTRKVVGTVAGGMYWRLNLESVLPENTRGIICVLENTLGQTFTFRVDREATFMGIGDLHDRKYDHLVKSSNIGSYIEAMSSPETRSLVSVDLNNEYLSYMLHVYPSSDTEAVYVNRIPTYIALVMVGVFLFTSMIFVLYTIAVNRRQRVVMDRAVASGAIVASLFPSQVREKIYKENLNEKKILQHEEGTDDLAATKADKPIADLFENTTVMFADMVGFTKWSSSRTPVQVFELLETVYQAFDAIAARRKVFKVETIGDCYLAVAGLPEPQEDHAVVMAKFAADCIATMGQVVEQLSSVLGADTADLTIRIGQHSGSVTGGVLRGQKSRFQLFGDTMNMAARMESTGTPGKVHVSLETANELIRKGKLSWVTPRGDTVNAKGIGELQTYWVSPKTVATSVNSYPSSKHTATFIEL